MWAHVPGSGFDWLLRICLCKCLSMSYRYIVRCVRAQLLRPGFPPLCAEMDGVASALGRLLEAAGGGDEWGVGPCQVLEKVCRVQTRQTGLLLLPLPCEGRKRRACKSRAWHSRFAMALVHLQNVDFACCHVGCAPCFHRLRMAAAVDESRPP